MESTQVTNVQRTTLLRIVSLAGDLGVGLPPEHGLRACYIALQIGGQLGLDATEQRDLIHVGLLKDTGCTSWSTQVAAFIRSDDIAARREMLFIRELGDKRQVIGWAAKFVGAGLPLPMRMGRLADFMVSGRDFMREGFQSAGEVARRIAKRLGASESACLALPSLFEQWNGKGMPLGLRGESIPVSSRIVFATSYLEAAQSSAGRAAAVELARHRAGTAFDPDVANAFEQLSRNDAFWEPLEGGATAQFLEEWLGGTVGVDEFAACCADFVDMKAYWLAGHSRRVADLSERLARRLRLSDAMARKVRIGGLMHDLGLVSVPSFVLNKPPDEQTAAERGAVAAHGEILRLLLEPFEELWEVGEIASLHHQRLGAGSDAATGDVAPTGDVAAAASAIAAADAFDELTHDTPGAPAIDRELALSTLRGRFGVGPFAAAVDVLSDEVSGSGRVTEGRHSWPAGLTNREVDVLRLLASGQNRKQIAGELVVSDSTVRSHLEHIYDKVDVSTNVGAVLFAIENGLVV